jgi:hypothetical protein
VTFTASELNSLASGGGALSTGVISNSSNLDQFIDLSFVVTVGGTTTAASYITLFLLPLNQDGSTYGDNYASSTTTQPSAQYAAGSVGVKIGVTSGNTITGTVAGEMISPGDYKVAFGNNLGVALNATSALTLKIRAFDTNLNA